MLGIGGGGWGLGIGVLGCCGFAMGVCGCVGSYDVWCVDSGVGECGDIEGGWWRALGRVMLYDGGAGMRDGEYVEHVKE